MRQLNLSQAKLLSELVIPVQIILGELPLSAAQLIDLRGGEYFPLLLEEDSLVTLVVSGEAIAKGKLVKDESSICVLITEIISDNIETQVPICPIGSQTDKLEELI